MNSGIKNLAGSPAWRLSKASAISVLAGLACLLLAALPAFGQSITGTLTGTVEDQSGAGVPHAPVVALNTERGITYQAVTSAEGVYVLPLLPVGDYQVTIEAPGFRKFVRSGVGLGADERLRVDARLEVGQISEQVTVTAGAPLVKTDQATLGASFSATSTTIREYASSASASWPVP